MWQRALMLDWMTQIGLPTQSMVTNLATDLTKDGAASAGKYAQRDSWVLSDETSQTRDLAIVLTSKLLKSSVEGFNEKASDAVDRVKMQNSLVAKALMHNTGHEKADVEVLLSLASSDAATIDRSLMLTWVDASKGDVSAGKAIATPMSKPWVAKQTNTAYGIYQWTGSATDKALNEPMTTMFNAVVSYDSSTAPSKSTLAGKLERGLMKIERQKDGTFSESAIDQDEPVKTDALYVETLTFTPSKPMRYVVIEAALPAGAQVESGTWGIKVGNTDMPKANFQDLSGRYAVPVGDVDKEVVVQHLIRFSQRGKYVLPPARAYNMYSPDAIVLESHARKSITVK